MDIVDPHPPSALEAIVSGSAIPSPCTDVCTLDPATGWCVGCLRSIDEIAAWASLGTGARRAVWKALPARRTELERRDAETKAAASAAGGSLP